MSKIDLESMRRDRKRADKPKFDGIDILTFEELEYLVYITPPVHGTTPYVEVQAQYQIGPNKRQILNASSLEGDPGFLAALEARDLSWDDVAEGWEMAEAYAKANRGNKRIQLKDKWYFGCVVLATRRSSRDDWEWEDKPEFQAIAAGKTIFNGITDVFFDEGDITDPDAAILIRITRKGQKLETEYTIRVDSDSLREPHQLDPDLWDRLEKQLVPGGDADLMRLVAQLVRSSEKVEAVLDGTDGDNDEESEESSRSGGRAGSRVSSRPASSRRRSAKADDDEDDDEDSPPPRRRARSKDDEDDDTPAPRRRRTATPDDEDDAPRRRRSTTPAADSEDSEDSDDEPSATADGDDDAAQLEEALSRGRTRRRKATS